MPATNLKSDTDSPGNVVDEQRSSDRESYEYSQLLAPMFGNRLPSDFEYFEVDCHDICTGGFAFFLDSRPPFDTVVVRLGRPPMLKHVRARVANVTPVWRNGALAYRVGCRFVDQVIL